MGANISVLGTLPEYYNSPILSDGVVKCGDREFNIHKIILCTKSKYFENVFTGNEESLSDDGFIRLEDVDASAIEIMLRFMYTADFDDDGQKNPASAIAVNIKAYAIADKYEVGNLKELALEKFEKVVQSCWMKDEFLNAIVAAYRCTSPKNPDIRGLVVQVAAQHIAELLKKRKFCEILENTAGFAADLSKCQANPQHLGEQQARRRLRVAEQQTLFQRVWSYLGC